MQYLNEDRAMLIVVRHGQSEWNFANRFIGWYDSPLTEEGRWEAMEAGRLLRDHRVEVDEVHTSMLDRTLLTGRLAVSIMREAGLKVPPESEFKASWRLNERSYGALTGRNKKECTRQYGKEQLLLWRRSWDIPPPAYEDSNELYQEETTAFRAKVQMLSEKGHYDMAADPPPEELPRGESLKLTMERVLPYWENTLLPALQKGKKVMVVGHENALRALTKHLDDISNSDILEVDIPRAMPMVYVFDKHKLHTYKDKAPRLEPMRLTPKDAADGTQLLSSRYLVDSELIAALHHRDVMNVYDTTVQENLEEVCIIEEDSNMCQVIGEYLHDPSEPAHDHLRGEPVFVSREDVPTPVPAQGPPPAFLLPVRPVMRSPRNSHTTLVPETSGMVGPLVLLAGGLWMLGSLRFIGRGSSAVKAMKVQVTATSQQVEDLPTYFPEAEADTDDSICEVPAGPDGDQPGQEVCELMGFGMEEDLHAALSRAFTDDEIREAHEASGLFKAKPCERPAAMWLIGPSATGKSTVAPYMAEWVGMSQAGYVLVDGETFRDSHAGYQEALASGQQHGCVWWSAYIEIRENINLEKQRLLDEAKRQRKNLMIPSTCLRKSQCIDVVKDLVDHGYVIHIVGVYGNMQTIIQRGTKRALQKGKRYDPREFQTTLTMVAPMLRQCTGKWRMVCTTDGSGPFSITAEGESPPKEEQIKEVCGILSNQFCQSSSQH